MEVRMPWVSIRCIRMPWDTLCVWVAGEMRKGAREMVPHKGDPAPGSLSWALLAAGCWRAAA